MTDGNLINYKKDYDIITLLETWSNDIDHNALLPGYASYGLSATKLKKRGRRSGGIMVYIKDSISRFFQLVKSNFSHGLVFIVDENLFGSNLLYIVVYLPPEGSAVYRSEEMNGINLLEDELVRLKNIYPNHEIVISGDMNARTGTDDDFLIDDRITHLPIGNWYAPSNFNLPRCSRDKPNIINGHGKSLLDLCKTHDIHIINGRKDGDRNGELTCFTSRGSSVVDYTLASANFFDNIIRFDILMNDVLTHLPQSFQMKCLYNNVLQRVLPLQNDNQHVRTKYKWHEKSNEKLLSYSSQCKIKNVTEKLKEKKCYRSSS